jgi:MinD-like ATPase involved in chromosome partitioning or flagellar assembly
MAALLTSLARDASSVNAGRIDGSRIDASQLDAMRASIGTRTRTPMRDATGPVVLVLASGRGGSGTTLASALLALAAAGDGHRTLLIDGDELVGPHALLLGVEPTARWPELRGGALDATQLALPIASTLSLVAGGLAGDSLTAAERRICFARLQTIAATYALVVIDAGSRLDTVLAALEGARSTTRLVVVAAGQDPIALASSYALLKAAHARHPQLPMDVLANRLDDSAAVRVADTIAQGAEQFLGRAVAFAGALPHDTALDAALRAGMPFLDAVTGSPVAVAAHDTVLRMVPSASTSRFGA